jgi:hypothetical protein
MNHPKYSRNVWILFVIGGLSTIVVFLFAYFLFFPRFLKLPIQPPEGLYGQGEWNSITYSVFQNTSYMPILDSESFIWRQFTFVTSDREHHKSESWESIVSYFDTGLVKYGWSRHTIDVSVDIPCDRYLPEAQFINSGKNGYVYYVRENFEQYAPYGGIYLGDLICLAVWGYDKDQDGLPTGYNIVLLTAKRTWSAIP